MKKLKRSVSLLVCCMLASGLYANSCFSADSWKVTPAKHPTITIESTIVHDNDPKKLFGFNINYVNFQKALWDSKNQQLKPTIADLLSPFEGAIYRYPGGLVANSFHWQDTFGELSSRKPQSTYFDPNLAPVSFGVDEYIDFVEELKGVPWYVLNIYGLDNQYAMKEGEEAEVVASNLSLIKYLVKNFQGNQESIYLQLGNELDRAKYQWTAGEYSSRAKALVDRVSAEPESDDLHYVSSLRDFDWIYRGEKKDLPRSTAKGYMAGVMKGLDGSVDDYSLNHYYDGNRIDGKSWSIPFWLWHLTRSFDDYRSIENKDPSVWITEHGRQPMSNKPGSDNSKQSTSNMAAALSTADYLIAMGQFKEIKGAIWHCLCTGAWQLFDHSAKLNDLSPRPLYWGLRVLRMIELENVLETHTASPNLSEYDGGYDIRALSFIDDERNNLGLRVVNRASSAQEVRISFDEFKDQKVELKHYSASIPAGQDPEGENVSVDVRLDPELVEGEFNGNGSLYITLPPSSVSSIEMRKLL